MFTKRLRVSGTVLCFASKALFLSHSNPVALRSSFLSPIFKLEKEAERRGHPPRPPSREVADLGVKAADSRALAHHHSTFAVNIPHRPHVSV